MSTTFLPQTWADRIAASYKAFEPCTALVEMTADEADYILKHHNNQNRRVSAAQVKGIEKSIDTNGYLFDGTAWVFNDQGHMAEGQHRATVLARTLPKEKSVPVVMVFGVREDVFTLCRPAKGRTQKEEIERHDQTATPDQIATVGQVARRKGIEWTVATCYGIWVSWKAHAIRGIEISEELTDTDKWSSQQRLLRAFATMQVAHGSEDECVSLYELLTNQVSGANSSRLGESFLNCWEKYAADESNEGRVRLLFRLLCMATDQLRRDAIGGLEVGYAPTSRPRGLELRLLGVS